MKKFVKLFIFAVAAMALAACNNDFVAWDIATYNVVINIVDSEGNNLLDESVEHNLIGQNFTVDYNGKLYPVQWENAGENFESRALLARFTGLTAQPAREWVGEHLEVQKGKYKLCFGEFEGEGNQTVELMFGAENMNGLHKIELHHFFGWKKGEPEIKNFISVNGEGHEGTEVTIVLR